MLLSLQLYSAGVLLFSWDLFKIFLPLRIMTDMGLVSRKGKKKTGMWNQQLYELKQIPALQGSKIQSD